MRRPPMKLRPASQRAYAEIQTYSVEAVVTAVTTVAKGDQTGTRITGQNTTGRVNIVDRQLVMSVVQSGWPLPDMQTVIETFLVNEWLYVKGDVLDYDDPDHEVWVKLDLADDQLNRDDRLWHDKNSLELQVKLLGTATALTRLPDDRIDGKPAYVLDVMPKRSVLNAWVSLQPPWRGPDSLDLSRVGESLSFRLWVSKDTFSVLKSVIELESFDSSDSKVVIKAEVQFSDFNAPFDISLPQEARQAIQGPIS